MPDEILDAAQNGELLLFCGAGISTESKTVLPFSLYSDIQRDLKISDNSLSFSELMQKYCDLPNGRKNLLKKIKKRFEYIYSHPELEYMATMFHRELAELYFIKTIITTNWDTYFEKYCFATPITIPEDFVFWDEKERCVLKIHGSITNPSTIIATKDDYSKCTDNLHKGIIGATLKTLLANRTTIFVGFSFGDEDFAQILEYLRTEMNDIFPHIYIVTLDNQIITKLNFKNATYIVTDGTYFLHQLKLILKEKNLIENCDTLPTVKAVNAAVRETYQKISNINFLEYPSVIYCLAYQDGILHAFDRFIQLYNKGDYNIPGNISATARKYKNLVQDYNNNENYGDQAYCEGYLNGLIFIGTCEKNQDIVKAFPVFYLPNAKHAITSYNIFFKELKRVTRENDKYHKYATSITKKYKGQDIVIHHQPYL
ncbi:MAG: SIR2 family protein [Bacillota bacterium]|nr:SIR2 family protein [Bacillota bacterium]